MTTKQSKSLRQTDKAGAGGVQSVHRALDLIEVVAGHGGHMAIGEIAATTGLPLPTIHRLLRTLVERGYMRQLANRRYALGFQLLPLGLSVTSLIGASMRPALSHLVAEFGETTNLAVLTDDQAEYVAQVPSHHAMRMFTEVGRRVELHSTGVGKALLSQLAPLEVRAIVRRMGLPAKTSHTITRESDLLSELDRVRERGYAVDEEEQEVGVRCIAVPIPGDHLSRMAISVSGPVTRMTDVLISRAIPVLKTVAMELGNEIALTTTAASSPDEPDV